MKLSSGTRFLSLSENKTKYTKGVLFMIKRKIAMTILSVLTLIFEILPYGAVCVFSDGETEYRRTFSYFSLVPYGYANFSPLITAVFSCVILVLCVILCFRKSQRLSKALATLSGLAAVISFMPFFIGFGFRFYGVCAAAITALLAVIFILALSVKNGESI